MIKGTTYNINSRTSASEIKKFRKVLGLTQADFAKLIGVSRPTVERMETSKEEIEGPLAVIIDLLGENMDIIIERSIPRKEYPLRLWYMFNDKKCTLIDVDQMNRKISIKNYVSNIMYRAFGVNNNPTYEEYEAFLESRCFPRSRDKMKIELDALGIPFYDPMLIIEKTEGRMAEDDFWIMIEK